MQKEAFEDNLYKLFMKSIDGVILLFFLTTALSSAGASRNVILNFSIFMVFLIALIMGISSFISVRQERKLFYSLEDKEQQDVENLRELNLLKNLGIGREVQTLAQEEIEKERTQWNNLVNHLKNDQNLTTLSSPLKNGITTWFAFITGGIIPVMAYFFTDNPTIALKYAGIISLPVLFILGIFKSVYLKLPIIRGAMTALFSGAFAGIAGYFIARLFIQGI